MVDNCIFCKIIAGEIPSFKIYENDCAFAFLDINPVSPGHVLVVSKKHYANLEEINEAELCELIKAVKKVGLAIKTGLGTAGYNLSVNNDPVAGQIIPHLHFHLVPRSEGDGLKLWPQRKYGAGEGEAVAEKIKKYLIPNT
ncbi:MAG: HIT family protein [Patescibacteria group bacterium]|jgi:histidine triad (HIT) family protein